MTITRNKLLILLAAAFAIWGALGSAGLYAPSWLLFGSLAAFFLSFVV